MGRLGRVGLRSQALAGDPGRVAAAADGNIWVARENRYLLRQLADGNIWGHEMLFPEQEEEIYDTVIEVLDTVQEPSWRAPGSMPRFGGWLDKDSTRSRNTANWASPR